MAGGLTAAYALLVAAVMPSLLDATEFLLGVAIGVVLLYSGLQTLHGATRGPWITLIIMGFVLATQLWAGYAWGRTPQRAGLSLYLLTVPLVVILVNTRAISATRKPQPRTASARPG
jgi:hypothetical protein